MIHYGEKDGRVACRLFSSNINKTTDWGKVTCDACRKSYAGIVAKEMNKL